MQRRAGRSADQWRGLAAVDAGDSQWPTARYDSACDHGTWQHQHQSGDDRGGDAEHAGMRREHDDESGSTRHDGAGQRHGCGGNAWRLFSAGLLTAKHPLCFSAKHDRSEPIGYIYAGARRRRRINQQRRPRASSFFAGAGPAAGPRALTPPSCRRHAKRAAFDRPLCRCLPRLLRGKAKD